MIEIMAGSKSVHMKTGVTTEILEANDSVIRKWCTLSYRLMISTHSEQSSSIHRTEAENRAPSPK